MSEHADDVAQPKLTYQIVPIPGACGAFGCVERPTHAVGIAAHVIPEAPVLPRVKFVCDVHAHPHLVAEELPEYVDLDAWQDAEAAQTIFDDEHDEGTHPS